MQATAKAAHGTEGAARPEWADRPLRLDPFTLPQTVAAGQTTFTLQRDGARLRTRLGNGLPLSLAMPAKAYRGVVARAMENGDGTLTVTLRLAHADPAFDVPLCVADTVEDASADWHSWSRQLGLPMLMEDEAGTLHTVRDAGSLVRTVPSTRRKRITAPRHRPNFLRRRRPGRVGPVEVLSAHEIIART